MSIKVMIPEAFQVMTKGVQMAEVNGSTVGQCLEEVVTRFPGLRKFMFLPDNNLPNYVLIVVNGENISNNKLQKAVKDGDTITPMIIIGGG